MCGWIVLWEGVQTSIPAPTLPLPPLPPVKALRLLEEPGRVGFLCVAFTWIRVGGWKFHIFSPRNF